MTNLFTYGSLMCKDIMLQVSEENPKYEKALLHGFFCSKIHRETYPGIFRDGEHTVDGIIYYDISPEALTKLDNFEGEYYQRTEITVRCSSSIEMPAATYVIKAQYHHLLNGQA